MRQDRRLVKTENQNNNIITGKGIQDNPSPHPAINSFVTEIVYEGFLKDVF